MKPSRCTWPMVAMAISLVSFNAAAFTEPVYDFGNIDTFSVFTEHAGLIYQKQTSEYTKALTFSIDTDSSMRVDLYSVGINGKYSPAYLYDAVMGVFDATSHTLLGVASVDPVFSATEPCTVDFSTNTTCPVKVALTLSGPLHAGSYAIVVSAMNGGYNFGPEIRIGVTKNVPDALALYASAMLPAVGIPEPSTAVSMGLGLLALGTLRKRRQTLNPM